MKQEILLAMQKPNYRPGTLAVLFDRFKKQTNYQELTAAINALEKEGLIARNQRNEYALAERLGYVRGRLDLKKAGYGFLSRDDKGTDLFIPASQINNAMDGDYCLARITKKTSPQRMEGEISRVLKRGLEEIVGEYYQGAVFPKNNPGDLLFRVRKDKNFHLLDHTLVRAKVVKYGRSGNLEVQVLEVLASMEEKDIDILEVMHRRNLNPKFPDEVLEQVQRIPSEVLPSELKGRRDLRNQLIFTIDGDDTKDIDDAISLRKNDDGHWILGVHIADVSHYVTKGSPLDKNALERGTSVYFADRVIPMLPRELSNGICSLNPDVDRLTLTCEMEINAQGEIEFYDIYPSVIHSRHQMTYKKCNAILAKDPEVTKQYEDIVPTLFEMEKLASILRDIRSEMGSIDFDTIEPKILFTAEGDVSDIVIRERGISERIIEEFMLVANQVVAANADHMELPFLYRIHEQPDATRVENLFLFAKELAYVTHIPDPLTHQDLQKLLEKVEGTKYEKVVNMMMLRSMAKARYSESNVGHYGLAFEDYTHFTSPIRRYPDLIVHRYTRDYLFLGKLDKKSLFEKEEELPEIALQTSQTERNAMLAEREVMDIKKAEYMVSRVGQEFEGVVSSLTRFGMFVELPNTVEGLIHISSFPEAMEFLEDKMMYLGISSRKEYTIGMIVKVRCAHVNPSFGKVDFELI